MQRQTFHRAVLGVLVLGPALGCGSGTYQPSRSANFQIDREAEIDDEDIRKAFDARPQMPSSSIRLSYYTFDPEIADDLDKTLSTIPGVSSVYRIPPLLVTGERRLQENHGYYGQPQQEVSVKKLRLLAARATTDVLVIVDHGHRNQGINGLFGLSVLIFPIFFVPILDTLVKGYVETFVVDVRNGYLYGHVIQEDERGDQYSTIYAKKANVHAVEQWKDLRARFGKDLAQLFENERKHKAPSDSTPPPQAPATPASAAPSPVTPP